jgi:CheY-like chemotaxis protein
MELQNAGDLLSHWGIVPKTACNGAEALALASERQFDFILMDIAMPVMDGLEATWRIRQLEIEHADRPRTPIVAYTTGWLLSETVLLARVGFDEAINKPCGVDEMEACLRRRSFTTPRTAVVAARKCVPADADLTIALNGVGRGAAMVHRGNVVDG